MHTSITQITAVVTILGGLSAEHRYEAHGYVDEEEVALSAIWASGRAAVDACARPFTFHRRSDGVLVSGGVSVRLRRVESPTRTP